MTSHGGPRPGAGRKRVPKEEKIRRGHHIYVPADVTAAFRGTAEKQGISLSRAIVDALRTYLARVFTGRTS
ncbi:MAG: hypothetical protein LBR82_01965 [Desulfovibrio sp.]|jgi:LDH2 family malate/lactate/ureidoglycolate dehydrogenase|nr:hypothetical protein [Desulfovibrio sp.]